MKKNNFLLLSIFTFLILFSCNKEEEVASLTDTQSSLENAANTAEKGISDAEDAVSLKSGGASSCGSGWLETCAIVTSTGTAFPKTITIDFGTGCEDLLGRVRSGKIFIHLTDSFSNEGAVRTVTFENFTINGIGISGSRVSTNTGTNSSGLPTFNRVIDTDITNDGLTFQRNFNQSITWLSGFDTPACGDNVFSIMGEGSITRPNGVVVARSIVQPVFYSYQCPYVISGVVEVYTLQGVFTINYGMGTCDNQASVTNPNGVTTTLTLPG